MSEFPFFKALEYSNMGFPGGSVVKNPHLPMQATQVRSLGQEDPLEKEMATHSQYSCMGNPMDRGAWQAAVQEVVKESDTTWLLMNKTILQCTRVTYHKMCTTFWYILSSLSSGVTFTFWIL